MLQQHIPLCINFMYGWSCCRRGHAIIKVNKVHPVGTRNKHTATLVKEFENLRIDGHTQQAGRGSLRSREQNPHR